MEALNGSFPNWPKNWYDGSWSDIVMRRENSQTKANLSFIYEKEVGNDGYKKGNAFTTLLHVYPAFEHASAFDIIHSHDPMSLFLQLFAQTPFVHTIHGTLEEKKSLIMESGTYINSFRLCLLFLSVMPNGRECQAFILLPLSITGSIQTNLRFTIQKYVCSMAWTGHTKKKEWLKLSGWPAALVYRWKLLQQLIPSTNRFFDQYVKPEIDGDHVQFMGELSGKDRLTFLQNAFVLLFPIRWHEPFGLVMPEAMACGTPVIATSIGSTPEIVEDGVTGYLVQGSEWDASQPISAWREDTEGIGHMETALGVYHLSMTGHTGRCGKPVASA